MRHLLIAACLGLAACAGGDASRQYLLTAPDLAAASRPAAAAPSVGLREIALPLYARRPQIASLGADGVVVATDDDRWAEDPPRAATRLVARRLADLTGGEVFAEPWPEAAAPAVLATVEVDRFIGALGGAVTLEGQTTLAPTARRRDRTVAPFRIEVATDGPDHAALSRAYGAALARLADEIAARL